MNGIDKKIRNVLIGILVVLVSVLILIFVFGRQQLKRELHSIASGFNGLDRHVRVYDVNGKLVEEYSGKFDIEYTDERIMFDDEKGNRHIIYFKTGMVLVDENEGE